MVFLTEDDRVFELDLANKSVYLYDEYDQKHDLGEHVDIENLKELGDFVESLGEEDVISQKTVEKMMKNIIDSWSP